MAGDITRCVALAQEASSIESEAMQLDRNCAVAEAADVYRHTATRLREAAAACPVEHPDRRVLEEHAVEVLTRAAYLDSLGASGNVAAIPLEEHINGVLLTLGTIAAPTSEDFPDSLTDQLEDSIESWTVIGGHDDRAVVCAAAAIGGATGLFLMGPVSGATLGAVAAYATTREDTAGCAARKVGTTGLRVVSRARCIDEEYRISGRAASMGQGALNQVIALDSRYGITNGAKQVLSNFNERHKVADRVHWGLGAAGYALSNLVSKATGR
uniref:Uncharacterized protein n=1 Tax=Pyrodinium bahamense TaxID=73915 RepID=A0A7S0APD4_9DINO|eukprot:CAMPEP_0179074378 /NCGR_PEP_ID=MMETSP0796-20121207/33055_1 /TAXON_ID=73915 /ORGANISM="Pyrodinium bahamense, Strain pbaha01" /LENGTH=269 /DNA_ID=CAMNT_0020771599 /DNA_START=56 /DNA_END=865 /DNA_ORIENTATION=+